MIQPYTAEWLAARCGKPTASQAWRVMSVKKNGEPTAERESYMVELLTERLTGSAVDHYTTAAMQRGLDLEPQAIREYESMTGYITTLTEWVQNDICSCTPDAFVEENGLLEVKCPLPSTVVKQRYFEDGFRPNYYWQCIAQMVATGRDWCDLLVYCPDFQLHEDRFWMRRITASENIEQIAALITEMKSFVEELEEKAKRI